MAELVELDGTEHDGDPWAEVAADPRPWCDTCEGAHDDHVKWLAERAAVVAVWSGATEALEDALARSRAVLSSVGVRKLGPVGAEDQAVRLHSEIGALIGQLRQVADAAAWRARQEAAAAAEVPGGE